MREVAELDAQARQTASEREAALSKNTELIQEKQDRESTADISERLLRSMEAQVEIVRVEREEHNRQHAADKEYLREIFTQLEAQLALAHSEREELQARADRERRASARRIKELEDSLAVALAAKERVRDDCGAPRVHACCLRRPPTAHSAAIDLGCYRCLCRSLLARIAHHFSRPPCDPSLTL